MYSCVRFCTSRKRSAICSCNGPPSLDRACLAQYRAACAAVRNELVFVIQPCIKAPWLREERALAVRGTVFLVPIPEPVHHSGSLTRTRGRFQGSRHDHHLRHTTKRSRAVRFEALQPRPRNLTARTVCPLPRCPGTGPPAPAAKGVCCSCADQSGTIKPGKTNRRSLRTGPAAGFLIRPGGGRKVNWRCAWRMDPAESHISFCCP